MGRKTNNMPVRKKKIKDKNNLQIQGKAGRGKKREKGRAARIRELAKTGGVKGVVLVEKDSKPTQVNWVDLAKKQEQRAVAAVQPQESEPAAKLSKKARKKQRLREEQEQAQPKGMERSFHPKEGIRASTVQFGADGDDDFDPAAAAAANGPPSAPTASAPTPSSSSRAPPPPRAEIAAGSLVSLTGLQKSPELNGKLATCVRWDAETSRWLVSIAGVEKSLRPENLVLQSSQKTSRFCAGAPVRICGLQAAKDLNETLATCKSWDSEKQRWLVSLDDGSGEDKLLKLDNLELALRPGSSVRLAGLCAQPELNGRSATCIAWDGGRQRWRVRVEGGEEKALRPENLEAHGDQEPPAVSPAINQLVEVCEESAKLGRLTGFLKKMREEEKRGVRQRSLVLVFCARSTSVAAVTEALKQAQLGCVSIEEGRDVKRALSQFDLDQKRILVVTDESAAELKLEQEVAQVIGFDFPSDLQVYCRRFAALERNLEGGACTTFFTPGQGHLAEPLLALLERARARVEPELREMAAREAAAREAPIAPSKRRRRGGGGGAAAKRRRRQAEAAAATASATPPPGDGGEGDGGEGGGGEGGGEGGGGEGGGRGAAD